MLSKHTSPSPTSLSLTLLPDWFPGTTPLLIFDGSKRQFKTVLTIPDGQTYNAEHSVIVRSPFGLIVTDRNMIYWYCGYDEIARLLVVQNPFLPPNAEIVYENLFRLPSVITLLEKNTFDFKLGSVKHEMCSILRQVITDELARLDLPSMWSARYGSGDVLEQRNFYYLSAHRGSFIRFSAENKNCLRRQLVNVEFSEYIGGTVIHCLIPGTTLTETFVLRPYGKAAMDTYYIKSGSEMVKYQIQLCD